MKKFRLQHRSLQGLALRKAGWKALVSDLGLVNATRFIMQSEQGREDYTKVRERAVKGKRVTDLYRDTAFFEKRHFKLASGKSQYGSAMK